jgi:putative ABC transport system permease protein
MTQDLLVAARMLLKRPGYALAVIVTLALGIGASAMMFSLVDAALLRPLPFRAPDRLVMLTGVAGPQRTPRGASIPEIGDWRTMNRTLDGVASVDTLSLNLKIGSEAERVQGEMVSASYFSILGVSAMRGRTFLDAEDAVLGQDAVTVVSARFWHDKLGSDPAVLGRTIVLNDRPVQIVGVMPEGFAGLSFTTDVWTPSMLVSLTSTSPTVASNRGNRWLLAIGRLKEGETLGRAQEDLSRVAAVLEKEYPDTNRQRGVDVAALTPSLLGDTASRVRALFAAVLLVLAVACANVAALQLVRTNARRRELAVRVALGARRWHVVRQVLCESLILAIAAGILGALGAAWGTTAAVAWLPEGALPPQVHPSVDPRTLVFTIALSLTVALFVGVIPAVAASRDTLADVMKEGGRAIDGGLGAIRRLSTQQVLVATEIAAAMVLLTVAGLLLRSLERQTSVPLGIAPSGVTIARVTLPPSRYAADQRRVFIERLDAELRRVPVVRQVAIGSDLPLGSSSSASLMLPDTATTSEGALRYYIHQVTPEMFDALGIRLVAGRAFTWQDRAGAPRVAIVNDAAAQRMWGTVNVVGRHIRLGRAMDGEPVEIVGVVGTVRYRDLVTDLSARGVEPDVYFPYMQAPSGDLEIGVRTADGSIVAAATLQHAVAQLDAGLPVFGVRPLTDLVGNQTSGQRFVSTLVGLFSATTLILAAVGLYGLMAYVVGLSRREIAIRLALGADRRRVAALIVRNGMLIVLGGLAIGVVGALAAGRAIESQLFATSAVDPLTFAIVATLLLAVTFIASLLPTIRAVTLDPQSALRAD